MILVDIILISSHLAAVTRWMTWLYLLSLISTSFHLFFSRILSHSGLVRDLLRYSRGRLIKRRYLSHSFPEKGERKSIEDPKYSNKLK
jgi:hypothetical protein